MDGDCQGNPGPSRGGMVLRNSEGMILSNQSCYYVQGSNMVAECLALLDGLQLVKEQNFGNCKVCIESDSQVLIKMVRREVEWPWKLWDNLSKIVRLLESLDYSFFHVYREANAAADCLAKLAVQSRAWMCFPNGVFFACCSEDGVAAGQKGYSCYEEKLCFFLYPAV